MKVACTVWRRGKEGDNIEFLPIPMLESIDGTKASTVGIVNPYRYRGYRYDVESGLYYLQNRYYNPEWGRFVNADALAGQAGELLSHNIFAYCKNDPINMSDDTGFRPAFDSVKKENAYYDWKESKKKPIRRSNKHRATMRITPSRGTRLEDPNTDGSGYMGNNVGGGESGFPSSEGISESSSNLINPNSVRFTQDSISSSFRDGTSITDTISGLKSGSVNIEDIPEIRIFEQDGNYFSLDNRRLYVGQQSGVNLQFRFATPEELINELPKKFTTINGGLSIKVRGGK